MPELFERQIRSEALTVKSVERLVSITISSEHNRVLASYDRSIILPDGTALSTGRFSVIRSLDVDSAFTDWVAQGAALTEKWRSEDVVEQDRAVAEKAALEAAAVPVG